MLFVLLTSLSLFVAPGPSWRWRLSAAVIAVVLGWRPARAILFQRGAAAVARFEWSADGRWWLGDRYANRVGAQLARQSAGLGPWLLLVWHDVGRPRRPGLVRYGLIDARYVSPEVFRALRGRLKLLATAPERPAIW